jgi:hypothetical protein
MRADIYVLHRRLPFAQLPANFRKKSTGPLADYKFSSLVQNKYANTKGHWQKPMLNGYLGGL